MYLWVLSHTEMFTKEVLVSLQLLILYCDLFYVFGNKSKPSSFKLTKLCVNRIWNLSVSIDAIKSPIAEVEWGVSWVTLPPCGLRDYCWHEHMGFADFVVTVHSKCGISCYENQDMLALDFVDFALHLLRLLGKSGVFFIQSEQPAVHSLVRLKQRHNDTW